jgi:hypothetical protein
MISHSNHPDHEVPAEPPPAGHEELGHEDVRIPQLKIRQELTRNAERVPEGSLFVTSDPGSHSLGRELVLLDVRKERSLLLPYFGGEAADALVARILELTGVIVPPGWDGPVCFSRDRVRPVEQEEVEPLADECAACPMARWRTVRGRRLQDCAESYRALFYDLATGMPVAFFARGSAIRPTRDLLTNLQVACRREARPAYAYTVELITKRIERPDGSYHVPVFGLPQPIEDSDEIARLAAIRKTCALVQIEED